MADNRPWDRGPTTAAWPGFAPQAHSPCADLPAPGVPLTDSRGGDLTLRPALLLDVGLERLPSGPALAGSLGAYRIDVLRAARIPLTGMGLPLRELHAIPFARRLDGGVVVRVFAVSAAFGSMLR